LVEAAPEESVPLESNLTPSLGLTPESPEVFPHEWEENFVEPDQELPPAAEVEGDSEIEYVAPVAQENAIAEEAVLIKEQAIAEEQAVSDTQPPSEKGTALQAEKTPKAADQSSQLTQMASIESMLPDSLPLTPFISPPPRTVATEGAGPKMITIVLRGSGDRARDVLHMRRVHGTLISYPGEDRFAFYVIEGSSGYLLEFPNDTTHYADDLKTRLEGILDSSNLRVETITFQ